MRTTRAIALVLAGLLAVGCTAGSGPTTAGGKPTTKEPKKVAINYGVTNFLVSTAMVFSVPRAMGYWAEEGLEVAVQGADGAAPAIQQLIAKQVQITFTGLPSLLQFREQGAPIKAVASAYDKNPFYPVVKPDGGIDSIKDLKGKKVGVSAVASTNTIWFKGIARSEGLDPDKDIEFIGTGAPAASLQALNGGQVHALQLFDASYVTLEQQGARFKKFDKLPFLQDLTFVQGMIAHDDTIQNEPEVVTGLLRGIAKAANFCMENPEAAVKLHWELFPTTKPTGVDEATAMQRELVVLKSQLEYYAKAAQGKFGEVSTADIVKVRDLMYDNQVMKQKLEPTDYYTDRFVKDVNTFDREAIKKQAREKK